MVSQVIPVSDFDLVIFGGSGDLAQRKILPGLFRRMLAGQMPKEARIIAVARGHMSRSDYQDLIKAALEKHLSPEEYKSDLLSKFIGQLDFMEIDVFKDDGWSELGDLLRDDAVRAFYFSVGPSLFGEIARKLIAFNLTDENSRIVVEKPFGRDSASAHTLNQELRSCFDEKQIYRIDHYLGKETVQNLMAIRFGNALFEPLWNQQNVDHIQITAAEELGVGGRGAYYDKSGAVRDMVQNHLMQLLCLTTMEPPSAFEADAVRDEKLKIIKALKVVPNEDVVRGQYLANGEENSYLQDVEDANSKTECFIAMKVEIANWRWAGTPIYMRTGKKMRRRLTEIAVIFKNPPHSIFEEDSENKRNALVIRLQPQEGITLHMTIKEPGPGGMRLREVPLDMSFADIIDDTGVKMPDAYERLIMDVIRGNQTLFMRGDEVEAAWNWIDPIIAEWENAEDIPKPYKVGGSGPTEADDLLTKDGREWREVKIDND